MRTLALLLIVLLLMPPLQTAIGEPKHSILSVHLLDGYVAKEERGIDVSAWTIEGRNGLRIHFESGPSEGRAVDAKQRSKYQWYREQTVNGHTVYLALVRAGRTVDPDLDKQRDLTPGNVLMVTFALGGSKDHAANFVAKVASPEEIMDTLLMVLTFDPSKGIY